MTFAVGQKLTYPEPSGTVTEVLRNVPVHTSSGLIIEPVMIAVDWDDGDTSLERPVDLER